MTLILIINRPIAVPEPRKQLKVCHCSDRHGRPEHRNWGRPTGSHSIHLQEPNGCPHWFVAIIRLLSHFVLSIHCIYFHSFPLIYEKYHLEGKMICALALEMVNLFEEMIVLWMVFKINQEIHDKQLSRIWCFCNIR